MRSPQLEQMIEVWLRNQGISARVQAKCKQEDMEVTEADTESFLSYIVKAQEPLNL